MKTSDKHMRQCNAFGCINRDGGVSAFVAGRSQNSGSIRNL